MNKKTIYLDFECLMDLNKCPWLKDVKYEADDIDYEGTDAIYSFLDPKIEVKEYIQLLIEKFNIFIITPLPLNSARLKQKYIWTYTHFPELFEKIIFTRDFSLLIGDYLIVDENKFNSDKFVGKVLNIGDGQVGWEEVSNQITQL